MESKGGCCIARYATGAYDMSKWDKIMLRFRPIAPKPVAGTGRAPTASDGSSSESSDALYRPGRPKRKYVRAKDKNSINNNTNNKRRTRWRNTTSSPEQKQHPAPVVTLPLLPETPDLKDLPAKEVHNNNNNVALRLSFENRSHSKADPEHYWNTTSYSCVRDTWDEGEYLGSTDEERRVKLSRDTCPGFISDGYGRVTWTNGAYREIVGEGVCLLEGKVSAVVTNPCFTCRVRVVQYDACGNERSSLTVPCDAWRMDSGGFAWRLDVKAALSLSLGC